MSGSRMAAAIAAAVVIGTDFIDIGRSGRDPEKTRPQDGLYVAISR